ncbi:MAG: undecaprenyldiphospho-muramoylpentapeptide beta-N-acetylglucosaminyltransferase [Idiomarina sp.]|nr:undecaprenyldiphospho-muramoylpentapeptide beta-N-acetylglucosaminyltransferase [Idiomarina sp.]
MNRQTPKHVMIFAGGTGGHVYPALAVAKMLRDNGYSVSWVGTAQRIEGRVVPAAGFEFHCMEQQGLRGNGLKRYLKAPFALLRSVWQARRLIKDSNADLVLGFGGYTAGPGGVAAKLAGVPLLIHEQNAAAGLTNKLLARIADRTLLGFAAAKDSLSKGEWVGNPVRAEIFSASEDVERGCAPLRILVIGGSLGAQVLNEQVPAAMQKWRGEAVGITHQVGQGRRDETLQRYQQSAPGVTVEVHEFIEDMAKAYAEHDVVICRAGALTVAEIAAAGIPSVLVPYPHAVDDHQTRNAEVLVMKKAAMLIAQPRLTPDHLVATLEELCAVTDHLQDMGARAKELAQPEATQKIVRHCQQLMNEQGVV